MYAIESLALSSGITRLCHRYDLYRSSSKRRPNSSDYAHNLSSLVKMRTSSPSSSSSSSSSSADDGGSRVRVSSSTYPSSSSPPPTLHFFVRLTSRTLVIHANPYDMVESVIDRIHETTGIPTSDQRLIYCGRQVEPYSTLAQSGIKSDSTLQLTGRLRSTIYPRTWRLAIDLIFSVHKLLDDGIVESPYPEDVKVTTIEQLIKGFLREARPLKDKAWASLEIFLLAGVPNELVKLYLSPMAFHQSTATQAVQIFRDFGPNMKEVQLQCAPIVFEFCKLLAGTVGKSDPLYISCRSTLAGILKKLGPKSLTQLRPPNVIYELFSFVREMKEIVLKELSSESMVISLDYVEVFSGFLDVMLRVTESWVGGPSPIQKSLCGSLHHCYEYWIEALHAMFPELLVKIDAYLKKVKELYLYQKEPPVVVLSNILTVLTQCNAFSKFYDDAEMLLHCFLLEHRDLLNLLLSHAKKRDDLLWILKYKDVTDFGARKNLVMMMLPLPTEADGLHEMLIDRSQLLAESFEYITRAEANVLHGMIFMEFKNEEATGPGVLREWFCLLCQEIFSPKNVLFLPCPNDRRRFFLNPTSVVDSMHLKYFGFCGRVIALALMHKVQVGIVFDRVFFLQLAGESVTLEDIQDADPCLYKSCKQILEMDDALLDSDALGLTFMMEVEELGSRRAIELCLGGKDIVVNSRNKEEYVNLLIQHNFVTSIASQLSQFAQGFGDILSNSNNQKLFFQSLCLKDFDRLLGGSDNIINVTDWKAHTEYNGYKENDRTISWFWKIVEGMTAEKQRMLLFFWTSVKYLPADGFGGLASKLYICKTPGNKKNNLPTSHTCFYQLCLPSYRAKYLMNDQLQFITQEHVSCTFGSQ